MSLEDATRYARKEYWEDRFETEEEHDWLGSYENYGGIVESILKPDDRILILGCGNSTLSENIYKSGCKHVTNIDYSVNVIRRMREKYCDLEEMRWTTMDILDMKFIPASFDVVIDKATLDSFMVDERDPWNISLHMQGIMDQILQMVSHVLKKDGKFISMTWAQPHFRKRLLAKRQYDWSIDTKKFGTGFEYFIYIMKKGQSLSEKDASLGLTKSTSGLVQSEETLEDDVEDFLNHIDV
ncbi:EEF1A lysine methyltransferase 4-like [Watersipora subatra]|uniref:EEF1A lysine methyltransferase 4-like n=1 Tax=Watersipora subatra TaxID=2589382 RepID=UPI00355B75FD